ncbi:MAG: hypothetical protein ACD_45C00473G0014 [uncultured bacterium]|nr:MAG: hypothetical protein ACD_45C00473G0014 [uncultured bacterium]
MSKIKKVSSLFRLLFQAIFILYPLLLIAFWIHAPDPIGFHPLGILMNFISDDITRNSWYQNIHSLAPINKFLGLLISLIPFIITEFILYFLIKLFGLYKQADIFSLKNVNYIKKIGYTLLIGQLLNPIYQAFMTVNLSWSIHPRYLSISVSSTHIEVLLTALLIILISWIMAEGCKLREEQQLTI